ncbi:MAG: hypothetical protein JWM93_1340 [Frankiales bacterium]|nr:hypothetical protein [Frankiales bacterium]
MARQERDARPLDGAPGRTVCKACVDECPRRRALPTCEELARVADDGTRLASPRWRTASEPPMAAQQGTAMTFRALHRITPLHPKMYLSASNRSCRNVGPAGLTSGVFGVARTAFPRVLYSCRRSLGLGRVIRRPESSIRMASQSVILIGPITVIRHATPIHININTVPTDPAERRASSGHRSDVPNLEIADAASVQLRDILSHIVGGDDLFWSILDIWAIANSQNIDMSEVESKVLADEGGMQMTWHELLRLSKGLLQFIDGTIVGYSGRLPRRADADLRESAEVVLQAVDSSYWNLYFRDGHQAESIELHFHQSVPVAERPISCQR